MNSRIVRTTVAVGVVVNIVALVLAAGAGPALRDVVSGRSRAEAAGTSLAGTEPPARTDLYAFGALEEYGAAGGTPAVKVPLRTFTGPTDRISRHRAVVSSSASTPVAGTTDVSEDRPVWPLIAAMTVAIVAGFGAWVYLVRNTRWSTSSGPATRF